MALWLQAMGGDGASAQEQAHQPDHQGPGSSSFSSAARQRGEQDRGGWARLDEGILPLVASRLQSPKDIPWEDAEPLGPARLVCRQWAAELLQYRAGKGWRWNWRGRRNGFTASVDWKT